MMLGLIQMIAGLIWLATSVYQAHVINEQQKRIFRLKGAIATMLERQNDYLSKILDLEDKLNEQREQEQAESERES